MFAERISKVQSVSFRLVFTSDSGKEDEWLSYTHVRLHTHIHTCTNTIMKPPSESASLVASLVTQLVNNPPAMWETWVRSLGWEDRLVKGKATHSSILAWRIPWTV